MTIQQMREKRNELARETRNLLDTNTQGKVWDATHQAKYDANIGEIEAIDAAIDREQKLLNLTAEREFKQMGVTERDGQSADGNVRALFNRWLAGGDKALNADEWTHIRNTMSTTTNSEGGFTVPTEVANSVLDALKAYGGMREVATVLRTAGGNPLNYPTSDGTSEEGEIIAQNTTATDLDPSFGIKTIGAYKYSSKIITVPIELMQDSAVNIEAFVRDRIAMRLGRITNKHFTIGTGSSQPNGLVTASTAGKAGAVSATPAITYDDLVDLQHSVDPAYRLSARWMFADATLKLLRKLKDEAGRPIFVPGYEGGITGGAPSELLGAQYVINQDVAVPAASAKSVLWGDFSKYIIRDVMDMMLFRFTDSAYAKKGQVAFLAWMRTDGNLIDVGGAVKHFVHGAAS